MATVTATHAPTLSSDALFRAWSNFIHDALVTTAGWVDTAATGEVNVATMTAPGSNNTYAGFKVYRMADALQASAPCFLKVEFGRGNGTNFPTVRLTCGAVHDGAGSLTGTQVSTAIVCGGNGTSASAMNCFASGTTARIQVAMFADNGNGQHTFCFGVERTKDAAGADDATGIVFYPAGYSTGTITARSLVIPPSGGVPPIETRWMLPFSRTGASSIFNAEVAVGLMIPFLGQALRPLLGFGYLNATDVPAYASSFSATVYGVSRTFLSIGSATIYNSVVEGATGTNNAGRLVMLYE